MSLSLNTAVPTLPIKNRNTGGSKDYSGNARTPKKGGGTSKNNKSEGKKWADYTPSPWVDYGSTPWGAHGPMPFGQDLFAAHLAGSYMAQQAAADGSPTPTAWPATPTPSGQPMHHPGFGLGGMGMMPGMPFMPPPQLAAMAEAAANAARDAAHAAHAANSNFSDGSPDTYKKSRGNASDYDSSPEPLWNPALPVGPGGYPSKGSTLHGTGRCRPCAWFWKAQGCQCSEECNYCHLCAEGELKNRKKTKVAAMRLGGLTPKKRGTVPGTARNLRLSSLL